MPDNPYHGLHRETTEGTPVRPLSDSGLDITISYSSPPGLFSWLARLFHRKPGKPVITKTSSGRFIDVQYEHDGVVYRGLLHAVEEGDE